VANRAAMRRGSPARSRRASASPTPPPGSGPGAAPRGPLLRRPLRHLGGAEPAGAARGRHRGESIALVRRAPPRAAGGGAAAGAPRGAAQGLRGVGGARGKRGARHGGRPGAARRPARASPLAPARGPRGGARRRDPRLGLPAGPLQWPALPLAARHLHALSRARHVAALPAVRRSVARPAGSSRLAEDLRRVGPGEGPAPGRPRASWHAPACRLRAFPAAATLLTRRRAWTWRACSGRPSARSSAC
jgi:hypothetical protein